MVGGATAAAALAGCGPGGRRRGRLGLEIAEAPPRLVTDDRRLQGRWDAAVEGLRRNLKRVARFPRPVLIEGEGYAGVWLECAPHEGLLYAPFAPQVAAANHEVFFELQREDGYLPCYVWARKIGESQIQMVVPIAATALELHEQRPDDGFLRTAYAACSRWDAWLRQWRDTRRTGLCEAFCGYDTGHDNSPRFKGLPWTCKDGDARLLPRAGKLPYLAPDLSATVYGGRIALARMARLLGLTSDEAGWLDAAERIRKAILERCLDAADACFYDVDADNRFVRIRGDALLRVLGERVVDQTLFDEIYRRHVRNPQRFWTPYPFPSIAADDPAFDRKMPPNSWGGPSQALTAMRAPRWMEHYGKHTDLTWVMQRWVDALCDTREFQQQVDPWTGAFSTSRSYSPAMLVLIDFATRLHGVRRTSEGYEWGCRLPANATRSRFELGTPIGLAELENDGKVARLVLARRELLRVDGSARVRTDFYGKPVALVGTELAQTLVTLTWPDGRGQVVRLDPDAVVKL